MKRLWCDGQNERIRRGAVEVHQTVAWPVFLRALRMKRSGRRVTPSQDGSSGPVDSDVIPATVSGHGDSDADTL